MRALPETLESSVSDCKRFQAENAEDLAWEDDEQGGHDFWLTRNGHGCGFWPEPAATRLTKASKAFGEVNLYVGDDGLIYGT